MEGADADPIDGTGGADVLRHRPRQRRLGALHLDDDASIAMAGQHVRQRRHADPLAAKRVCAIALEAIACVDVRQIISREIADRAGVIGRAIERLVVDHDRDAIGRQLHVELQAVSAEGETVVECHHRVLRSKPRTATVGKDQGAGRLKHGDGHPRMFA